MSTLRKALKLAKKCGMTKAEFAKEVLGCGSTKLWQVEREMTTLKPIEIRALREWYTLHTKVV